MALRSLVQPSRHLSRTLAAPEEATSPHQAVINHEDVPIVSPVVASSKGATSRPRSISNDAHNNNMMMTEPNNQAPLFGGNNSSNSNNNKNSHPAGDFGNYRDDCEDFNNSMYGTDVSTTYDDATSTCSAPADLFEWGMGVAARHLMIHSP